MSGWTEGWGWRHLWSVLGVLVLFLWLPFFAVVSLIGPQWAVFPALVVWGACLWLCVVWFKSHPVRVLLVGIGAVLLWHLVGLTVDALGWTA
jgi:hypothetical protein